MYAEHLGHCSILGSHITTDLVHPDVQLPTTYTFTEKIFAAIGLDRVVCGFSEGARVDCSDESKSKFLVEKTSLRVFLTYYT